VAKHTPTKHTPQRQAKFRQAAFVYLHYALLYEAAVWVLHGAELAPTGRGPLAVWLAIGAAIAAFVFWGLWRWQNAWLARIIWILGAMRVPALIRGAFLTAPDAGVPASLFFAGLIVTVANLWMLARAGWDL